PTLGPGAPRREPRVAARPLLARPRHAAAGSLHGQGRALELPPARPDPRRTRRLPGGARERRYGRVRRSRRAARGRRGARDVPAGDDPPSPRPALGPWRG